MSQVEYLLAFGLLSAVVGLYAFAGYARSILCCSTRPQRATWLIWSVLVSVRLMAQIAEGAGVSLWFAGVLTGCTFIIFLLSRCCGFGGIGNSTNLSNLMAVGVGVCL